MSTDDRIRAALKAAADDVRAADLGPATAPSSHDRHRARSRWLAPLLAAAAVIAVAGATVAYFGLRDDRHPRPVGNSTPLASGPPATVTTHASPTSGGASTPATTGHATSTHTTPAPPNQGIRVNCYFLDFACPVPTNYVYLQPLWPFANYAQATQWEKDGRPAGTAPWHSDAGETALLFTQQYLGFSDITIVTSSTVDAAGQAHVGVGYRDGNGGEHTAAVLHLVAFTSDPGDRNAGWEVVGSDDTTFSLERPTYGSRVASPMIVGGHITGVDENILVTVRSASGGVTSVPPIAAGGNDSPWSTTVRFRQSGVLTVAASTGGHLIQHERFAIQGVHTN